jgi:hypothetical protein
MAYRPPLSANRLPDAVRTLLARKIAAAGGREVSFVARLDESEAIVRPGRRRNQRVAKAGSGVWGSGVSHSGHSSGYGCQTAAYIGRRHLPTLKCT